MKEMTLDEAIEHCEEKAAELREYSDVLSETSTTPKGKEISDCLECAEEHEQLARWLKDYKRLLAERPQGDLKKIVTIPHELIEKLVLCVVNTVENIDWDKAIEAYKKRPQGECKTCRHRDPEDKKCDCGGQERQGCKFPVSDNYFCKFYERGEE